MHKVFLGIGTNLGDKTKNIKDAYERIKAKGIKIIRKSPVYETKPYGPIREQSNFLNSVVEVETGDSPDGLLSKIIEIENEMGRTRDLRWGPRIIDIDILFYDDLVIKQENLKIPHLDIENRFFALRPLSDIAPDLIHPVFKRSAQEMLREFQRRKWKK